MYVRLATCKALILCLGIGTVAFNTRLGLYQDSPPEKAVKFIEAVDSLFVQTQKIMMSGVSTFLRRYIDTPALKKFFKASDDIIEIGEYFISNKMDELKEMTEKGIEPSDEGKTLIFITVGAGVGRERAALVT